MLHIVNKSPLDRNSLDAVLDTGDAGAILLIEDGVYAATKGNAYEPKLKAAMAKFKIYALQGDIEARGIADRVTDGVAAIDYAGFVDLVANNKTNQSWL